MGYFAPDSAIRRIHGERAVHLYGPRALLMQAAHPVAVKGLLAHSSAMEEPYERLRRTAEVMDTIYYGTRAEADAVTRRVRAMHRRAGVDRPDLLMWVLYTLPDSALVIYDRYVGKLTREEREEFWAQYKVVGKLFGLRKADMPETYDDFVAYGEEMLSNGEIEVSDWARKRAREIVLEPPVPLAMKPLVETANQITIDLLPPKIRRGYGFIPVPGRGLAVRAGSEYVKRVLLPTLPDRLRLVPAAR
ncbi:MAG: DUF2236 domain-containing protein [Thermoleophilaceae bacterium]|nr:DUF2236 domain-containing protein [Thermoleophilaceae bacterium]